MADENTTGSFPTPVPTVFKATLRPTVNPAHIVPPPTILIGPVSVALESGLEVGHIVLLGILGCIAIIVTCAACSFLAYLYFKRPETPGDKPEDDPVSEHSNDSDKKSVGSRTKSEVTERGEPVIIHAPAPGPKIWQSKQRRPQTWRNTFGYNIRTHQGANLHPLPPGVTAPTPSRATRDNQLIYEHAGAYLPLWVFPKTKTRSRTKHSKRTAFHSSKPQTQQYVEDEHIAYDRQMKQRRKEEQQKLQTASSPSKHSQSVSNLMCKGGTTCESNDNAGGNQGEAVAMAQPASVHSKPDDTPYPQSPTCPTGPPKPHVPVYPVINDNHSHSNYSTMRRSVTSGPTPSRTDAAPSAPSFEHMTKKTQDLLDQDAKLRDDRRKLREMMQT